MNTKSHHRWMSDFLEEMGLPAQAEFQGYVLFNLEQNAFIATSRHNPDATSATGQALRLGPLLSLHHARQRRRQRAGAEYEIRALFRLNGLYLSCSV